MPKEQQYHAIDDGQTVIQAQPIPQNPEFTIITGDTPQPTRQKFISRVYSITTYTLNSGSRTLHTW